MGLDFRTITSTEYMELEVDAKICLLKQFGEANKSLIDAEHETGAVIVTFSGDGTVLYRANSFQEALSDEEQKDRFINNGIVPFSFGRAHMDIF